MTSLTMNTLLIATGNQGKRREYEQMLGGALPQGWSFSDLKSFGRDLPDVVEDRDTFVGNAIKKAVESCQASGVCVLAEDSGLVVDALDGAPGIYSARFAGPARDDLANNALLVSKLAGVPEHARAARYVALTCLALPNDPAGADLVARMGASFDQIPRGEPSNPGELGLVDGLAVVWFRGTVEGRIVDAPRGQNGFGYDPHFFLPELGLTMAELSADQKNGLSHRASALAQLSLALHHAMSQDLT